MFFLYIYDILGLWSPSEVASEFVILLQFDNGILFQMLFWWAYCEKKCSKDLEKRLKFEAEGKEFKKVLNSQDQFIQTVQWKVSTIFETEYIL